MEHFVKRERDFINHNKKREKISDHIDKKRNFIVSSISREFSKKKRKKKVGEIDLVS